MALVRVLKAYKSDHYPLQGNLSEEVLVLENGQAVYLNPGLLDQIYDSEQEAINQCSGTDLTESTELLAAWKGGYTL